MTRLSNNKSTRRNVRISTVKPNNSPADDRCRSYRSKNAVAFANIAISRISCQHNYFTVCTHHDLQWQEALHLLLRCNQIQSYLYSLRKTHNLPKADLSAYA